MGAQTRSFQNFVQELCFWQTPFNGYFLIHDDFLNAAHLIPLRNVRELRNLDDMGGHVRAFHSHLMSQLGWAGVVGSSRGHKHLDVYGRRKLRDLLASFGG